MPAIIRDTKLKTDLQDESNPIQTNSTNPQDLVQVHSELISSLITSVNDLRKEVLQVRDDNASLAAELRCLRQNSGTAFGHFSKLPSEIRCMIWKFALCTPQIHIVDDASISRSNINTIMQSCREARDRGIKLRFPYYQLSSNDMWDANYPKHYINLDIDTIWLADGSCFVPDSMRFFCGSCESALFPIRAQSAPFCQHGHRLQALAMNYTAWEEPEIENEEARYPNTWTVGSTDTLRHLESPRQLLFVMQSKGTISDRHVTFTRPSFRPWYALTGEDPPQRDATKADCWAMAESRIEGILKSLKQKREDDRKWEAEVAGYSYDEMDGWEDFMDISAWEIPEVEFVKAQFRSDVWIST